MLLCLDGFIFSCFTKFQIKKRFKAKPSRKLPLTDFELLVQQSNLGWDENDDEDAGWRRTGGSLFLLQGNL